MDLGIPRPTIVFGAMRGKKIHAVLRALAPLDPQFIFTRVDDPHARSPDELSRAWRRVSGKRGRTAATPAEAVAAAIGDPVVVAGSLYLVGEVRGMLIP
jgi:dihydrofolate synthase/folylpolyglutamate synthase